MALSKTTFTTPVQASFYSNQSAPGRPDLAFLELMYYTGVKIHQWLYARQWLKTHTLSVPVISIGNLTTGGTGKTPMAISLAQFLESKKLKVAVLSRGYGAAQKTDCHLADDSKYGDEAFLIQQHLKDGKVIVGKKRLQTGQYAIDQFKPDVIVLDDGFQHRQLARDIDVVLIDGQHLFGNGHLLPRGPLREPMGGLMRADYLLVTKSASDTVMRQVQDWVQRSHSVLPCPFHSSDILNAGDNQVTSLMQVSQRFADHSVSLLSGIAQPQTFETAAKQLFLINPIHHHFIFADHHNYTPEDANMLATHLDNLPDRVLMTTEKDWVKLQHVLEPQYLNRVFVLRMKPEFDWHPLLHPLLERLGVADPL